MQQHFKNLMSKLNENQQAYVWWLIYTFCIWTAVTLFFSFVSWGWPWDYSDDYNGPADRVILLICIAIGFIATGYKMDWGSKKDQEDEQTSDK